MRLNRIAAAAAALVTCVSLALPLAAQDVGANDDLKKQILADLDKDINDLVDYARSGEPDLQRKLDHKDNDILGHNQATSSDNPFMTEECQKGAFKHGVENLQVVKELDGIEEAIKMARGHIHDRQQKLATGSVTYGDYIAHIAECKGFCGPVVKELMACHIEAVTNSEHELVFFDKNKAIVKPSDRDDKIARLADLLKRDSVRSILLIGRASRTGQANYNRWLSSERARSVEAALVELGIPRQRVKRLAFGYEPPQITTDIAEVYKISQLYSQIGNERINQSVMLVVY